MSRRGITYSEIMEKAQELVEEVGYGQFSLRELAAKLGVKPASLYNHIDGVEEINTSVAIEVAKRLNRTLDMAIKEALNCEGNTDCKGSTGKGGIGNGDTGKDRAFMAAAYAYRDFAEKNSQLYEALINMPRSDNDKILSAAFYSFEPMRELIKSYGLGDRETINFIRGLRSVMHGFVELCNSGFMLKGNVSRDESYEAIIRQYLKVLKEGVKIEEI